MWLLLLSVLSSSDTSVSELKRKLQQEPFVVDRRISTAERRIKEGEELDSALLDMEVALALVPENPRVHVLYALLMEQRGNSAEARRAYETGLELDPKQDEARFRLAGLLFSAGEFAQSATEYEKYLATHPDAVGAQLQRAAALEKAGNASQAEKALLVLFRNRQTRLASGKRLVEMYTRQGRDRDAAQIRAQIDPPKRSLRELKRSNR